MLMHISLLITFNFDNISLYSKDFSSLILYCVTINKCCFPFFLYELFFMGVSVTQLINWYLLTTVNHGFSLAFYDNSLRLFMHQYLLLMRKILFMKLEHLTLLFNNIAFRILNTTFLNNNSPAIRLFNNISLMLNNMKIIIFLNNFHFSFLGNYFSCRICNNISINSNFFIFCINLIMLMLVYITILILSDLDDICFSLHYISIFISDYVTLYYWCYSVLLSDIFAVLVCVALFVLFFLCSVRLYLVWVSFVVFQHFIVYLYQLFTYSLKLSFMLFYLFVTVLVLDYLCLFIDQISILISDLMLFNNGLPVCWILYNISFRSHNVASLRIPFDIYNIFLYFHNVSILILSNIDINYFRTPILK